jgi:hypothetical protein
MKVISCPRAVILMDLQEFIELMGVMPDDYLVKLAKDLGIDSISLPYTKKKLIDKIYAEAEEQVL